ncbi:N-acetylmuramoyl-L-alanine amidase [Cytobacillus pseudoceanisediminis]|uniref:N-acetylmuramoyl-L-alanine amidase n=1 Tax=Cytobacillus pseudoceanisediminis TaxID=3051614 RepID=UPI003CFB0B02
MKIVLDAGHHLSTPGKRSPDGMREFEFNSRVADVMKAELEKYEGVTAYFAHDSKRDVPLKERTNRANALKADLFFSIHANANTGKMGDWGGIDSFIYTSNPKEARKLAEVVQRNLIASTKLRNRGVKMADFHVLRETNMTAILVEHGFMDSRTDLPFLKSDAYRVLCAKSNVKSIAEVYGLKLKQAPKPAKEDAKVSEEYKMSAYEEKVVAELKRLGITDGKNPLRPVNNLYIWHVVYNALQAIKGGKVK